MMSAISEVWGIMITQMHLQYEDVASVFASWAVHDELVSRPGAGRVYSLS